MNTQHHALAQGGWSELTLMEQLGNIGSEVARTARWRGKDEQLAKGAVVRALELFDLTIQDQRWKQRLKEITRAREVFCDTVEGGMMYHTSLDDLDRYFFVFALAAWKQHLGA